MSNHDMPNNDMPNNDMPNNDMPNNDMPNHELQAWVDKLSAMKPNEIADLCREEGIKGIPILSGQCVIARLLRNKTGIDVRVNRRLVISNLPIATTSTLFEGKRYNHSFGQFITSFDLGFYPDLETTH